MKIYTKTGDDGTTGLFAGPRVPKNDPRIVAYGSVDELNSLLGIAVASMSETLAASELAGQTLRSIVENIQSDLFSIGSELATPDPDRHGMRLLSDDRTEALESMIDAAESELPPLANFILPGGNPAAAHLHYARTLCRSAEREVVHLMQQPDVADTTRVLVYLNRLSDFFFVLARLANDRCGNADVIWKRPGQPANKKASVNANSGAG